MSDEFFAAHQFDTPYPLAPELCVEILSPSNTEDEMDGKRRLYFSQGAKEVWTCDRDGEMTYFDRKGEIPQSQLFPDFPKTV
jgi:Uma2 family endonuclease